MNNRNNNNNLTNIKKRKGISPLLATVLLLGITVVAGGAVYALYTGQSSSMDTPLQIRVDTATATKATDHGRMSLTIANTGSVPWETIQVRLLKGDGLDSIMYEHRNWFRGDFDDDPDALNANPPETALRPEYFTQHASHHTIATGWVMLATTNNLSTYQADLAARTCDDVDSMPGYDADDCTDDGTDGEITLPYGLKLDKPVEPGESISFEAQLLFEGVINEEVFETTNKHLHLSNAVVGDEIAVEIKVTGVNGESAALTTSIPVRKA